MAFVLPDTPLGAFVKAHYSPATQAGAFRKLKTKGFAPPGTTAGGSTRPGGTARDRLLPLELIGVAGVRGPFYGITPRINPQDFVTHTNDRGRTFYEPITDTTGLDPQSRASVRSFEAATAAQRPVIQGAYGDLQASLNQNADATKARLSSLGSLIQGSPLVAGTPPPDAAAQGQLADARRAQLGAQAAVTVGAESALPALAGIEGTKALTGWDAQRLKDRQDLLGGLREQQQKAAAATLTAKQNQAQIDATLRGQDLQLLGTQTTANAGLQKALLSSQTDLQQTQAQLENRLLIAELQGDVSTANNIRSTMAQIQAAGIRASAAARKPGTRAKDTAAFIKGVRSKLTGSQIKNPDYDPVSNPGAPKFITKPGGVDDVGLLRDALVQGVAILPVLNAIRAVRGADYARSRTDAENIRNVLIQGGIPPAQATKIVKTFTGVTPTSTSSG